MHRLTWGRHARAHAVRQHGIYQPAISEDVKRHKSIPFQRRLWYNLVIMVQTQEVGYHQATALTVRSKYHQLGLH